MLHRDCVDAIADDVCEEDRMQDCKDSVALIYFYQILGELLIVRINIDRVANK